MSDNNNNHAQIDDTVDSTPKWDNNNVSGKALWDNDNDSSNNNFTSQNPLIPNSNPTKSTNQINNLPTFPTLNVADVTEDFPTMPGQDSTGQDSVSNSNNSSSSNENENGNNGNNGNNENKSSQSNATNPTNSLVENNQTSNSSANTTANAQFSGQFNAQSPQEAEIAPFIPEDAKPKDNEQQEAESILPTKQDDASLKNQVKNSVSSEGNLSLRVAGVALVVIVLTVTYLAAKSSDPKVVETKTATNKPLPVKDLKSQLKSNFSSPDMGTCPEPVTANMAKEPTPAPIETPPPVIINTPPEPPPIQIPVATEPVVIEKVVEKPRQFAFRMRAGEETIKSYEQSLKPVVAKEVATNTIKVNIPRGTMISLMMMQPFRNDIPTTVKCQITADVKTNKGELLIPAGSIAFVPFSPFRNDKRVFNQVDRPATISISEDQEIQLSGNAVDKSGGIGIQGKLIKRGDAAIGKRIGRTMARVLTFGAAGAAGGVGGAVIAEAGSSAIDGSYVYTAPTDSYVEVPLGTIFFFNVSNNITSK